MVTIVCLIFDPEGPGCSAWVNRNKALLRAKGLRVYRLLRDHCAFV